MSKGLNLSNPSDRRKFEKQLEKATTDAFLNAMQTEGFDLPCPKCGVVFKATFGKVTCPACGAVIQFNPPSQ